MANSIVHPLLTPDNCVVTFIDHQPQMLFGVANFDRQTVINNVVGFAKAAKVFNVPVVLSTVETKSFSGYIWPQLRAVYPEHKLYERSSMNAWEDKAYVQAIEQTGRKKKLTGVQMGYESRCAPPHAFDVMLGSQLGIGAYRALVEEDLDGHMVSVTGQLDLSYVPFHELVNQQSLKTEVRFIRPGSDYHRLARFLETRTDKIVDWAPGRRQER